MESEDLPQSNRITLVNQPIKLLLEGRPSLREQICCKCEANFSTRAWFYAILSAMCTRYTHCMRRFGVEFPASHACGARLKTMKFVGAFLGNKIPTMSHDAGMFTLLHCSMTQVTSSFIGDIDLTSCLSSVFTDSTVRSHRI